MTKDFLEGLYLREIKSIPDISAITGVPISTVRGRLISHGIPLRSRTEGVRAAAHKTAAKLRGRPKNISKEWRDKMTAGIRKTERVVNPKGTRISTNGYYTFTVGPNCDRSVHIVLMEEKLGRKLAADEVVHHVDHNKLNNDISNLQLMTRAAHTSLHRREQHGKR